MIGWVGFYMGDHYVLLENSLFWKQERERASENRVARVLGLYFFLGQLQKTIRLQLSLFTNYRTVMFNSPRKDYVHVN